MPTTAADDVMTLAAELAASGVDVDQAVDELLTTAGGDRPTLVEARDGVAAQVHARVDDFEATATLQLLNRVLGRVPIKDPLDWRVRWTQRFRRP